MVSGRKDEAYGRYYRIFIVLQKCQSNAASLIQDKVRKNKKAPAGAFFLTQFISEG
jgi:hypothetical protein